MADWGYPYEGEDQVMRKRRFNCRHPEVVITSHLRDVRRIGRQCGIARAGGTPRQPVILSCC